MGSAAADYPCANTGSGRDTRRDSNPDSNTGTKSDCNPNADSISYTRPHAIPNHIT